MNSRLYSLAEVGSVLNQDGWNLGSSNHVIVTEMRHLCSTITPLAMDSITWDGNGGIINLATIWNTFRPKNPSPPWIKILWHRLTVAKFSFLGLDSYTGALTYKRYNDEIRNECKLGLCTVCGLCRKS